MAERGERSLVTGCLGCTGAGAVVGIGFVVLFGLLASQTSSCSFSLGMGPGAGTRSQRLPVTVTPRTGLDGGQAVRVTSTAFGAHSVVGVAVCLRTADTERKGLDACDTRSGSRYAVDGAGRLDARFTIPRTITVGARTYDCAGRARRCLVVAADADDFDRSGGQTVSFRTGLPEVPLAATPARAVTQRLPVLGSPSGAVRAGSGVTVLATGFAPNEPIAVAWCSDDVDTASSATEACEITDSVALRAVVDHDLADVTLHADARGEVRVTAEARASVAPFGSDVAAWVQAMNSEETATIDRSGRPVVLCRERPGRCAIVVAAVADLQRSAVLPYELVPG